MKKTYRTPRMGFVSMAILRQPLLSGSIIVSNKSATENAYSRGTDDDYADFDE